MPNGNNPITDQHTVPRVYLKGFSDDNERILYYDFEKHRYSNGRVKIKDLCFKKYMYEFYNEAGNKDSVNIIEKHLGKYEVMFSHYCSKLEEMMDSKSSLYNAWAISDEDIAYWIVYTVIQYLRSNHTISSLQELLQKMNPDNSKYEIRNTVLFNCLPLFIHKEDRKTYVFDRILDWFLEMDFSVVLSPNYEFITSDNPVCGIANDKFKINRFVFPITKNIAVQFIDKTDAGFQNKNTITNVSEDFVETVNFHIGVKAEKQIYFERIAESLIERIERERSHL